MKNEYPSKSAWFAAIAFFVFLFISFCYGDTASIIRYEAGFAESMLKGDWRDLYGITYSQILDAKANGLRGVSLPTYDLPLNIILGIWGIPLYLYRTLFNAPDIGESFGQMLYGKSIFLPALAVTIILVYKICMAMGTGKGRALWGAYLYFTSSIVTASVAIVGQCDVIGMMFILAGLLSFIQREEKKFLIFFILAMPFKMYALFFFLPLMLLREKRILMIITKLVAAFSLSIMSNISLVNNISALKNKAHFNVGMLYKLIEIKMPLLSSKASLFAVLFGILCVYCYLHKECGDSNKEIKFISFVSVLSAVTVFISFSSYPYWFIYLSPYLAVCAVFNASQSGNIILFETAGMLMLTWSNYIRYFWCYDIHNTVNMFLHWITGNPTFREGALTMRRIANTHIMQGTLRLSDAAYIVCMCAVAWLCRPCCGETYVPDFDMRTYARRRFLLNSAACFLPVLLFINAVI